MFEVCVSRKDKDLSEYFKRWWAECSKKPQYGQRDYLAAGKLYKDSYLYSRDERSDRVTYSVKYSLPVSKCDVCGISNDKDCGECEAYHKGLDEGRLEIRKKVLEVMELRK